MAVHDRARFRILGHERVALTSPQVEDAIRCGLMSLDTKVIRDGEGFATALRARPEFQHLIAREDASEVRRPEPCGH